MTSVETKKSKGWGIGTVLEDNRDKRLVHSGRCLDRGTSLCGTRERIYLLTLLENRSE